MQKQWDGSYLKPVYGYLTFFLCWLLYGIGSLTWSISLFHGVRYLFLLGTMLLFTSFFPLLIHRERVLWRTFKVLLWTFFVVVLWGGIESITLIHLPSSRAFGTDAATVTSVFTNQNDLATCITLALPFLITSLWMVQMNRLTKGFVYMVVVMALYVLIATGSRSNTLFALPLSLAVLIACLPFAVPKDQLTLKNISKGMIAAIVAGLIVSTMSALFLTEEARQTAKTKLGSTFNLFSDIQKGTWDVEEGEEGIIRGETGESGTVRKYLILNGLQFLQQSHYLGVGPGNIEPLMKDAPKVNKVNMHNWWIEILVNFGVIIFFFYMALYVLLLWKCWKIMRLRELQPRNPRIRWSAYSVLASMIGYFFGAIAPSTAIHFTPMWVVYGLGLSVLLLGKIDEI
ncbi:O-antigen ligase family protein [Hazenella coriacea]|uniref:O-antigen ligase family protein n=1 Tax=Hazenella coriacea TaxID=1179467 RepID=UPI0014042C12|nr:O-antigen ligase family protein [Hazenella coriacea]